MAHDEPSRTRSPSPDPARPPAHSRRSETGQPDPWHFGRYGEAAAGRWYRRAGYQVLARNWRCRQGEVDLIVERGPDVVFVEVKARTDDRFGTGAEAVGWRKQRRLRAVAGQWLGQADRPYGEVRFDVVEVDRRGGIEVHESCF